MTEKRMTATIRHGRLELSEPLGLPDGCPVEVRVRVPKAEIEERRMLLRELHELMRTNPFLGSVTPPPDLEW